MVSGKNLEEGRQFFSYRGARCLGGEAGKILEYREAQPLGGGLENLGGWNLLETMMYDYDVIAHFSLMITAEEKELYVFQKVQ